jgi:uncharacterized coiled-coil protein SlyX
MKIMTNKRLMILVCLITGLGVFAIGMTSEPKLAASVSMTKSERASGAVAGGHNNLTPLPTTAQQNAGAEAHPNNQRIPLHVVYGQVFRHIRDLNRQADKDESKGQDGKHFRTLYKRMAKLADKEAASLDRVAAEINREMDKLDAEAARLIKKFREKNPKGSAAPDAPRPKPPAELMALSKTRREKLLAAREKLLAELGDEEFRRFEEFLQERIAPEIRQIDLTAPLSNQ